MFVRHVGAAVAVAAVVLAGGGAAVAEDNRFAVVTINNNTKDVTIHFSYRWGDGEWKESKDFKPGHERWFAMPLDDRGGAPKFQIKINEAVGASQSVVKTFNLKWQAAPDKGAKFGHPFEIVRDKSDNDYVSVYDQKK